MKKTSLFLIFCFFVIFLLFVFTTKLFSSKAEKKPKDLKTSPTKVEVKIVEQKSISEKLSLAGEFFANESVSIQSEVSGRINYIGFADGETVQKNTLLVGLDSSLPNAEFLKFSAEYDLANANFHRAENLYEQNYLSSRSLDEVIASKEIAKAKKQLSKAILEQYKIKAPFNGRVGLRKISIGSYVKNGQELLLIQDLDILKFDFQVPERYSNLVKVGQPVTIKTNAFSDLVSGVVNAIDVGNQNRGRVLNLRTLVKNNNGFLRSGMFGKVDLIIQKKDDAVVVPEEALFSEQSSKFVWKVNEGLVKKTSVVTGIRLNDEVEIIDGLGNGDAVVVAGHLKLRKDGQKVVVVKNKF